ncbi:MAG: hypothetical protein P8X62_07845 [Flavobacteriaceae bacterium]
MIKKEVFIGILVGLIANTIGVFLATLFLGDYGNFTEVIKSANAEGFLGKLISLGAILNFYSTSELSSKTYLSVKRILKIIIQTLLFLLIILVLI